ncbi:hypothetical protein FZEAL_1888 [Fusarium zealandicum]|uniref:Uncharacterized protein n=1 Tax=Fusarium zealandicum TaxID=1053134 RepID=A0A8H4URV8_9HYPO|nr:hypothetical protein FZEAL_1888 [Fusarium zealandicum]
MPLLCCCKFRHLIQEASSKGAHDVALQTLSAQAHPAEQEQPATKPTHRHSLMGLADTAWMALGQPVDSSENGSVIHQIVDGDSDSDDDQRHPPKREKTSGPFDAVRNRLIRSISTESSSKHPSFSSLGHSEEEIARRAELRRLMHQRIQDELQTEQSDDDDSKKSPQGIRCVSSVVNLAITSTGPRHAIEFAVSKSSSAEARAVRAGRTQSDPSKAQESQDIEAGRIAGFSCEKEHVNEAYADKKEANEVVGSHFATSHFLPSTSKSRNLEQPHSQKSFQLSNSVTRLDRILGPDSSFNSRHASSSGDGHSVLGVWLIAQGLRSRDNSTLHVEEDEMENSEINDPTKCAFTPPAERKKTSLSDPYEASKKRVNLPSSLPSTTVTALDMANRGLFSQVHNTKSKTQVPQSPQYNQQPTPPLSDDVLNSIAMPVVLNTFADSSSSRYPSKLPSFQPSPALSQQHVYRLNTKDLENMELSPFTWQDISYSEGKGNSEEPYLDALVEAELLKPTPYNDDDQHTYHHQTKVFQDAASQVQSESASFIQREAELDTIERRFGVFTRMKTIKRVNSRFRENFNEYVHGQPTRRSFMSNIHLAVPSLFKPRSRKSAGRQHMHMTGIGPDQESEVALSEQTNKRVHEANDKSIRCSNLSIRPDVSPISSEAFQRPDLERQQSATGLWQRAIRLEAEERRSSSNRLSTPNLGNQRDKSSSRSLRVTAMPLKRGSIASLSTGNTRRETSQLTPTPDELPSKDNSKWLIQRWVTEMRPSTPNTAKGTESMLSVKLASPPKSWARFPSHNREERNKNATAQDDVHSRDFAVKVVSTEGEILWSTDVPGEQKPHDDTMSRSFSARLGEVVRSKIIKWTPSRRIQQEKAQEPIKGRVSSQTGHLEYPELEIQPKKSGYEELQVLEREISNLKGQDQLRVPEDELSRPRSAQSLGDRISAQMHETARESQHDHDDGQSSIETFAPPATPSLLRESIVATDIFVTPESRLSYRCTSQQGTQNSDTVSTTVDEQKTLAMLSDDILRPRASSWAANSLRQLDEITGSQMFARTTTSPPTTQQLNGIKKSRHLRETRNMDTRRHSR